MTVSFQYTSRQEYILGYDGLSTSMLSGTETLPKEWVELRLYQLGLPWRQEQYS